MSKKRILILSYSSLNSDPRILRQVYSLQKDYEIETCAFAPINNDSIKFYSIYTEPQFSLVRKIKRLLQFAFKNYQSYYWDENKIKVRNLLETKNYSAIIANDIQTLPLALAIANNKPIVYFDAHEYHPEEFQDNLKWRIFNKKYVEFLCKNYISLASDFSTVAFGIANKYELFTGVRPKVITNATNYHDLIPSEIDPQKIKIIHHGAAIQSRKIELMIEMFNLLDERFVLDFMLTGTDYPYINKLKRLASKNLRIRFLDPIKSTEICNFTNSYDLGLFLLFPTNFNYLHALPNKLYEFIQARLGIIISPNPEMAELVNKFELGIVVKDFNVKSMASEINKLTLEEINKFKINSNKIAKSLSAEDNMKMIKQIITDLTN